MDFFLCNRLELLSSTSHYFGDPSVPLHSTPPPRPLLPLTSLHQNTLFSIGEQWNFYFATDPRLKLHGLYYHKLSILPPPPSPSKPDPLLLDSRTRPSSSSPRLLHSTRSPSQNNHAPHPILFSLLHLFTPTHAHRHFPLSLRHHSFPILPPTRAKHMSIPSRGLPFPFPSPPCPVPCRASDQVRSRRSD